MLVPEKTKSSHNVLPLCFFVRRYSSLDVLSGFGFEPGSCASPPGFINDDFDYDDDALDIIDDSFGVLTLDNEQDLGDDGSIGYGHC